VNVKVTLNPQPPESAAQPASVLTDKKHIVHSKFLYSMEIWKTAPVLLFIVTAYSAEAQFQKGSILLEGSAGVSVDFKNEGDGDDFETPYQFNIGINAGYFLNEKNEIGIGLRMGKSRSYSNYSIPDFNQFAYKNSGLTTSVYWRRYIPMGERLFFSYAAGTDASFSKFIVRNFNTGNVDDYELLQLRVGITPSLVYMLNSKFGLRGNFGNLGFNFSKQKDVDYWENNFSMSFSPQSLNFGLFMVLGGSKPNN
jgi:hypothetical protein